MLDVFGDACTLRQFVAVLLQEVQELYDAAVEVQKARTLYDATDSRLDGIGRIVGEDRNTWHYSEDGYFHFDIQGEGFEQLPWWCINAPLETYIPVEDSVYKLNILARIIKNHTLVASVPELIRFIKLLLNIDVSFLKFGPNTVCLVVPESIDKNSLMYLTIKVSDTRVDDSYRMPYPATLNLCDVIYFLPEGDDINPFFFDRDEPFQWDNGYFGIGVPINN